MKEKIGKFTGMPQDEYRKLPGLANSGALLIARNPSDYIWTQQAPTNYAKVKTKDVGTALHALLLEPETYDDLVFVSSVKGRQTKAFEQEVSDNPDNIVLTQDEAEQVRIMAASVKAHPKASSILESEGDNECSIFANDEDSGVLLKCRPDKDCVQSIGACVDVKTTDDISKWRSDKEWINPMFEFNYGHQAAFYLHTLSLHYGFEVDKFIFIAIQKKIELGRYPVAVFEVTKEQLVAWGFWARMLTNIEKYKHCSQTNDWMQSETFNFYVDDEYVDDVEVTFEGDEQC